MPAVTSARQVERQVDVVDDRRPGALRPRRPASRGRASGSRRTSSTPRPSTWSARARRACRSRQSVLRRSRSRSRRRPRGSRLRRRVPPNDATAPRPTSATCGRPSFFHRSLAITNGRSMPDLGEHRRAARRGSSGRSREAARARTRGTRAPRGSRNGRWRARGGSRARARGPSTRASVSMPGVEILLDGGARDERDAVAAAHRARHRLLQAELEPHVEVAQAHAGAAQLVLDHLPDACALLHHDQLLARARRRA